MENYIVPLSECLYNYIEYGIAQDKLLRYLLKSYVPEDKVAVQCMIDQINEYKIKLDTHAEKQLRILNSTSSTSSSDEPDEK